MRSPFLSRDPYPWDGFLGAETDPAFPESTALLAGKRVLITGAGGYLGSAIAQAIAAAGAASICCLDLVEHGLYQLQGDLEEARHPAASTFALGSVNDVPLLRELFRTHEPHLVVHAAALKHVPMLEHNVLAAATTNIFGTRSVLEVAAEFGAERCLLLSTDKAVDPIGIMGMTKAAAEHLALGPRFPFTTVLRLSNVLGSTGSVAPLFARQIARGHDLRITDRNATRFFLSETEAVACMIEALCLDRPTRLAVPIRAQRRRIEDLADYLLARLPPSPSRRVHTALRPGERLHERLLSSQEHPVETGNSARLQAISPSLRSVATVQEAMETLAASVRTRNIAGVDETLTTFVVASPVEVRV